MPVLNGRSEASTYLSRFFALVWVGVAQLLRPPSHLRRAEAARKTVRYMLALIAGGGSTVIVLMYAFDLREIVMMPPRGTPSLWMVRILTDFGKADYVLSGLAGLLLLSVLVIAGLRGGWRVLLLDFATRLQFVFFAVLFSVLATEGIKWCVGRGRPFVGGLANPFNFMPFSGTEAFASFPSSHAVTSFALAFAISAVWPRTRLGIYLYAVAIAVTRLMLLAHHPSDVVAGALVGTIGAMFVRYWFAVRRLVFAIRHDGTIVALGHPSLQRVKRVARKGSAS